MSVDLSTLSLYAATAEQVAESRRRTYLQWGKRMTLEEYLARDAFMDTFEHARDGRLVTWVLAARDQPTSLDFMCSCETYRREGLVWDPSRNNVPKEVPCNGIASVFTPPPNRGKGYAKHMMRLLHWVIADLSRLPAFPEAWGAPPPQVPHAGGGWFSVLYSDVGKEFYSQCGPVPEQEGWIVIDAFSTTFDIATQPPSTDAESESSGRWVWLDEEGALELWERDSERTRNSTDVPKSGQISLSFLPRQGVAAFQHRRNQSRLGSLNPHVEHWAVISSSAKGAASTPISLDDDTAYASWMMETPLVGAKTLIITRLNSRPEHFPELLDKVVTVARKHGMEKIEIYNLPANLQATAVSFGGTTFERNEHLSALKWYGAEDTREVAWVLNERYCWC
ncbi:Lysine acetyltransferase [Hypsizygus marmoreus]|uniref:Lysine acetyltransferase n=1 Tax=Hypsizygus marmoreus TaxID=39966 RepID=A0A369JHX9_HYPMA|nr:Lysine acetyltransferase [Hypsizygus marmoreus]